jgi:hypothetical protein
MTKTIRENLEKLHHIHFWQTIYVSRKGKKFRVTFACECGAGMVREIKFIRVDRDE